MDYLRSSALSVVIALHYRKSFNLSQQWVQIPVLLVIALGEEKFVCTASVTFLGLLYLKHHYPKTLAGIHVGFEGIELQDCLNFVINAGLSYHLLCGFESLHLGRQHVLCFGCHCVQVMRNPLRMKTGLAPIRMAVGPSAIILGLKSAFTVLSHDTSSELSVVLAGMSLMTGIMGGVLYRPDNTQWLEISKLPLLAPIERKWFHAALNSVSMILCITQCTLLI